MHARFFSFVFLFTLLITMFAAPLPEPESELASDDAETGLAARTLESRGGHRTTWYTPGLGSCGKHNKGTEMVVALDMGYGKSKCGKSIMVKYKGKSVKCKVVDSCEGCPKGGIDMSPAAFKKLAPLGTGVLSATWSFV